jgi:adenosylmethionine-8-amino-7-oxononanoate aminotransferase
VVVLMPPLGIEADVLEELVEITADSIRVATSAIELREAA